MGHDGISLNVMGDLVKGFIFPDQMGPESALVNGASPSTLGISPPSDGVSRPQPVKRLGEYARLFCLRQQVPVVRHQTEGEEFDRERLQHFSKCLFKEEVIPGVMKQGQLSSRPIADMESLMGC